MDRADFSRLEEASRKAVAHCSKVSVDEIKADVDVIGDVLEEAEVGPDGVDDAGEVRP